MNDDLYHAVSALLRELEQDLIRTVRARDGAASYRDHLSNRAIEIETRITEVSKMEQALRRMR